LDGQDDSACSLASLSDSVEDSTLQHSGDTCEDSDVLAPGMRSCMGDIFLPMEMSVTQSLPSQTFMLDMTQEDISDILEVVEEPCVVLEHKGHMDLQTQEERHGLEPVDYMHTYQYEEGESPLLGSLLLDQLWRLTTCWDTHFQDWSTVMRMHSLLVGMTISHVWTHLYGIQV
jgi:hypothetical protein